MRLPLGHIWKCWPHQAAQIPGTAPLLQETPNPSQGLGRWLETAFPRPQAAMATQGVVSGLLQPLSGFALVPLPQLLYPGSHHDWRHPTPSSPL